MAIDLNGTSQGLQIDGARSQVQNVSAATFCIWARLTSSPAGSNRTLFKWSVGTGTGSRTECQISTTSTFRTTTRILDADVGSINSFSPSPLPAVGEWHHYAIAWDFTIKTFYVYYDGVLQNTTVLGASVTAGNTSNTPSQNASIGLANPPTGTTFFPGQLDDFYVYNRLLGPDEVKTIMTSRGKAFILNGLAGHWQLAELGEGQTVVQAVDVTGNDGTASPIGSPAYVGGVTSKLRQYQQAAVSR